MTKRKLQIFLSSTYEDLIDHRLTAMEAILAAGHIPAAMEQFSPGDETAWEKIRRWIDESDGFVLILGGRYGSLEPESGKSYVELEYDYAVATKKPFFSLVVDEGHHEERVREVGLTVDERENAALYKVFRKKVTARLCGFWSDIKDIKSTIFQKLPEWSQNPDLVGWIRGDEGTRPEVASELARLSQENRELRAKVSATEETFDGVTFADRVRLLRADRVDELLSQITAELDQLSAVAVREGLTDLQKRRDCHMGLVFEVLRETLSMAGVQVWIYDYQRDEFSLTRILDRLVAHGLAQFKERKNGMVYTLTESGRRFRNCMLLSSEREHRIMNLWAMDTTTFSPNEIEDSN